MKLWPLLLAGTILAACTTDMSGGMSNDNANTPMTDTDDDMLDSTQVTAFREADARYGYDDAEIAYDENNCAYYSAVGPEGEPFREQLTDADGAPICANMQS